MPTRFWIHKNKLFKKDSNPDFGWPTFFMIFVFFNDGNMVSLFCYDLVLSLNKASNLYNYLRNKSLTNYQKRRLEIRFDTLYRK